MAPRVGILFNVPVKPKKGEEVDYLAEVNVLDQVRAIEEALIKLGFDYQLLPLEDDLEELIRSLKAYKPNVVINLSEGHMGDSSLEMHVPSILELLGIPYTGSTPLTLGLCQDKGLAKDVLKVNGVPTPNYCVMSSFEPPKGLKFPLIVKPLREDASIGISRGSSFVRNLIELERQVKYVNSTYGQPALVEEYVSGREFNVSILGNETLIVLPISEIVFEYDEDPKIVDYMAKWFKDSEEYAKTKPVCPAEVDEPFKVMIEEVATKAYRALKCRDYARIDIRFDVKAGIPYVLEVNPNPDVSPDSGFVRSLKTAGIPYEKFVEMIIGFALKRAR